jgi:hypothetical protein
VLRDQLRDLGDAYIIFEYELPRTSHRPHIGEDYQQNRLRAGIGHSGFVFRCLANCVRTGSAMHVNLGAESPAAHSVVHCIRMGHLDELERQVISFMAEALDMAPGQISLDSRLAEDLGMNEPQALELLPWFARRFNIDLSNLWPAWDRHFDQKSHVDQSVSEKTVAFTVQDLVDAANTGTWIRPD